MEKSCHYLDQMGGKQNQILYIILMIDIRNRFRITLRIEKPSYEYMGVRNMKYSFLLTAVK
jgi:hypothetical protein